MFTPIHRALGIEACAITAELLDLCIEKRIEEADDLDWKQVLPPDAGGGRKDWAEEFAKDVAAMAYSGGGWLVYGMGERLVDGRASASALHPVTWTDKAEQQLRTAAFSRVAPSITGLQFHPVPIRGGFVVLLHVPNSPGRPFLARVGTDAFRAPFRNGAHTFYLDEREIERAYANRFQQRREWDEDLDRLFAETADASDRHVVACAVASARPKESLRTLQEFDQARAFEIIEDARRSRLHDGSAVALPWNPVYRPGLRRWVVMDGNSKYMARLTLHFDGSVTATARMGLTTPQLQDHPYDFIGSVVERFVADTVVLVSAHRRILGLPCDYGLRFGLVGKEGVPLIVRATDVQTHLPFEADHSIPFLRCVPIDADLSPAADSDEAWEVSTRVSQDLITCRNFFSRVWKTEWLRRRRK